MTSIFDWLKAVMSSPDLPAWLQAFTALVALYISVWAVLRAGAAERQRDRLQAFGIAVAIYPEILQLEVTLNNTRDHFDLLVEAHSGKLVGQSIAATICNGQISIPPMLDRNVDRLFMLGERAGPSCLHVVNVLIEYNALVAGIAARAVMLNAQEWEDEIDCLRQKLRLLDGAISKCKHEVAPLHRAPKR
jgi:hypothetical protein